MSGGGLFNTVSTTATASASNQNDSKTETDLSADDSAVLGVGAAANTVVIPGMRGDFWCKIVNYLNSFRHGSGRRDIRGNQS